MSSLSEALEKLRKSREEELHKNKKPSSNEPSEKPQSEKPQSERSQTEQQLDEELLEQLVANKKAEKAATWAVVGFTVASIGAALFALVTGGIKRRDY